MKWRGGRRSDNIEDRRGSGGVGRGRLGRGGFGRGGFRFPFPTGRGGGGRRLPVRRGGIGGIGLIVIVVLFLLFGGDLGSLFQQAPISPGQLPAQLPRTESQLPPGNSANDTMADFTSVVLADTEDTWNAVFRQLGQEYQEPKLVLFSGAVQSACGFAESATGPFYCPGDRKIYIDLSFYSELKQRFGAPGDFAQAYVIAHEVGHHVQTLLGIAGGVQAAKSRVSQAEANALQVRMELQADCMAGLWAKRADRARAILEQGDIDEALGAAAAIGDDRLQRRSQGRVVPESFTHGTSAQRQGWFRRGFQSGQLGDCDTFNTNDL